MDRLPIAPSQHPPRLARNAVERVRAWRRLRKRARWRWLSSLLPRALL